MGVEAVVHVMRNNGFGGFTTLETAGRENVRISRNDCALGPRRSLTKG